MCTVCGAAKANTFGVIRPVPSQTAVCLYTSPFYTHTRVITAGSTSECNTREVLLLTGRFYAGTLALLYILREQQLQVSNYISLKYVQITDAVHIASCDLA